MGDVQLEGNNERLAASHFDSDVPPLDDVVDVVLVQWYGASCWVMSN
jgi:hypothetical protein